MIEDKISDLFNKHRWCYWVSIAWTDAFGEYTPRIVFEDVPGLFITDYAWGRNLAKAQKIAEDFNSKRGITPQDAMDIVSSSMRASNVGGF